MVQLLLKYYGDNMINRISTNVYEVSLDNGVNFKIKMCTDGIIIEDHNEVTVYDDDGTECFQNGQLCMEFNKQ